MAAAAVAAATAAGGHRLRLPSHSCRHKSTPSFLLARSLFFTSRRSLVGSVRCAAAGAARSTDPAPDEEQPGSVGSRGNVMLVEQRGGKMVAELVGAFNELRGRMGGALATTSSSRLLFMSLKMSIPLLQSLPFAADGRQPLSRALSVACLLADLQMDAEVISAAILREALLAGCITFREVKSQIGTGTAHLLHEIMRLKHVPSKVDVLDDESASALRRYCLTYYDIRALVIELALKLDMMRNLDYLPRYLRQINSLEVLKIYAPLAHAIGAGALSLELEDLSFQHLFPYSYLYVNTWLRSHESESKHLIEVFKEKLLHVLNADAELQSMVDEISIKGRYKSRFSTMKKLLRDGRKREEVNDLLGLRIILNPKSGDELMERSQRACYRTHEIIQTLWREVPNRTKDYIAKPKKNGYRSLHVTVDISEKEKTRPYMEIQIRTREMDTLAVGGAASHSLYKGGFTDPGEAKRLKAIMLAAAELAAIRLRDLPSANKKGGLDIEHRNHVFRLLDKNGDGRISIEELTEVMEDLGAGSKDAQELMQLLDSNSDGSLSSEEFDLFQKQVDFMRNLDERDDQYRTILGKKLHMSDSTGLIQVYQKELGDKLGVS